MLGENDADTKTALGVGIVIALFLLWGRLRK